MKKVLIFGSIAYDHLMSFDGLLRDVILKESLDNFSVSLFAEGHDVFFGGCAPNIAFSLKLLGQSPIVFGVAGNDFKRYADWLESNGISTENINIDTNSPTASVSILTDKEQNQFSIFSPGAIKNHPVQIKLNNPNGIVLGIISAELSERMVYMGEYLEKLEIPYIFDPSQALPILEKNELEKLIKGAVGVIVNEYESSLLSKKIGKDLHEIRSEFLDFIVVTCGENGCKLFDESGEKIVDTVKAEHVVDITGCGDAFRAGFIDGYVKGNDLAECCDMGNKTASIVLKFKGTQNHAL